jgi:hypothetical protein
MTDLLARADAELQRLEAAAATVAANLVDLDDNPARRDLDKGPLTGVTAAAWAAAKDALSRLWDGYALLTAAITEARAAKGRPEFVDLVLGDSIRLSTATVPLAQRGLLGANQVVRTCSPAELLSAMEAAFRTAVDVATRAGDAWHKLLPAAAEAAAALDHVRGLIRAGGGNPTLLDEADRRLGVFTATMASDPLGADASDLTSVRALIDRADAERTSAGEFRESLTQRLADAHRLLTEIGAAERAAATSAEALRGRFADEVIVVVGGGDLRPDLVAVEALAAAGHWSLISSRLAGWNRGARDRLAALREATVRNDGLLSARNELRGRFDAYQAKAARRGLAEHPDLAPVAEQVRAALWTAPCDLDKARVAVGVYQDVLRKVLA